MALTSYARGTGLAAGATTAVITPSTYPAAGSLLVVVVAYDNNAASGADPGCTVTDSKNNVWISRHTTRRSPGNATNDGTMLRIFTTRQEVGTLVSPNTITVTFGGATVRAAAALWEVTAGASLFADFIATGTGAVGASTTPSVTTGTINVGEMTVGGVANEYGTAQTLSTPDADSTNGTWSTNQYAETGSTTSGQNVTSQTKVQTTTSSAQTYNLVMATSADWAAGWIVVAECTPKAVTEAGAGGDASASFPTALFALTDAGAGGDVSNAPDAALPTTDAGAGGDASVVLVLLATRTDAATGADASGIGVFGSDSGTSSP